MFVGHIYLKIIKTGFLHKKKKKFKNVCTRDMLFRYVCIFFVFQYDENIPL